MIALDTNILVTFFVRHDDYAYEKIKTLLMEEQVFVSTTVILESEWVLRSVYGLNKLDILNVFEQLIDFGNVSMSDEFQITQSIHLARGGLDFADALHLALSSSAGAERFLTLDQDFVKKSASLPKAIPVAHP